MSNSVPSGGARNWVKKSALSLPSPVGAAAFEANRSSMNSLHPNSERRSTLLPIAGPRSRTFSLWPRERVVRTAGRARERKTS